MARVDPEDDSIRRFIVRHYRYDPERHQRRHVVVAAFDNKREFHACMREAASDIERRKNSGEQVDPGEHASGIVHEPGDRRRAANGRLILRSIRHGVSLGPWADELEMPRNMAMFRGPAPSPEPGRASRFRRRVAHWLRGTASSNGREHRPL
jgi:hypothetical protein